MRYIMALDQGTSSSRAIIFNRQGEDVAIAQKPFHCSFPNTGWVELDPEVLWKTTLDAAREAIASAGISAASIAALGITNQRETTLLWEARTGRAVYPAIVWQDRRTASHCDAIKAQAMETEIKEITGLLVDPYFSSTKLAWILNQVPGVRAQAEAGQLRFGTVDSFLVWRLTNGTRHQTDATNASRTQLFDLERQCWSDRLLDYFDIPASVLPVVEDCVADYGQCDESWFGARIPILGVAGDQQAALVGQACFEPGMTKSTYGTGCFVISNTGNKRLRSGNRLLSTVGYRLQGQTTYALEGSIFVAGAAVKWLREQMQLISTASETQAAAEACGADTRGVYVIPAFTGLGAPHWQPLAQGMICGLSLDTSREQIITATLESVGFQTAELLQAMADDGAVVNTLRVDGGMVVNEWLCQFLADLLQVVVERPRVTETTALGAVMLAGLGAGWFGSLGEAAGLWQAGRTYQPAMPAELRTRLFSGWQAAVQRLL